MSEFQKPSREVNRVFLHCSASDNPLHDDIDVIRDWHVNGRGWSDVGYHYFIRKDGTVEKGRPLEKIPAAQIGHNVETIAICCHGLKIQNFTHPQYEALITLCNQIKNAYSGEITFHGHCEVSSKSCPVYPYQEVLGLDEDGYMIEQTNSAPSTEVEEISDDLPTLKLFSRGASVKLLQTLLKEKAHKLAVDGIFGKDTLAAVKDFQTRKGLRVDGIVGRKTWAALTT